MKMVKNIGRGELLHLFSPVDNIHKGLALKFFFSMSQEFLKGRARCYENRISINNKATIIYSCKRFFGFFYNFFSEFSIYIPFNTYISEPLTF
jgi:hypothetical protein